jgi:hypothetical protein
VEHDTQPVKVYANRVFAFGGALLAAFFVTVTILSYFVLPTPEITARPWLYQEPYKTLVFAFGTLLFGALLVMSLYWTFTPLPMLLLNATELVYRPYPLVRRSYQWADIINISASKETTRSTYMFRYTVLRVSIKLRRRAAMRQGNRPRYTLTIRQSMISISYVELVHLMRRYHKVDAVEWDRTRRIPTVL